jgi:chromosome segregation ATPase
MSKTDPADKWKKEVEILRLKINDYESVIAKLQSEDSAVDNKLENLNKLHAQKIRALMQSIQELKKQNATIRAQGKENNRSKLIEKLKTELVQQEISIQALRDLVKDDEKCDEQIINYLNKGPPRIRPMSREEMKIQIRKLQGRLGMAKTSKGDKAVDDLESLLDPSKSEEVKLVDPLQNEKIVELVEQIQNLQLDLRSRDSTIDHLRFQTKKLQEELMNYRNSENSDKLTSYKVSGIENEKQSLIEKLNINTSNAEELKTQLETALIDLKAKNDLITSLKKRVDDLSSNRTTKEKEAETAKKQLKEAMSALKNLENENKRLKDSKEKMIEDIQSKELELEEIKINQNSFKPARSEVSESVADYRDLEIEALQAKISEIQKQNNLPESFMAAERAETDKYKEKMKELYLQVADLQEELEYLRQENIEHKQIGAAKVLSKKVPQESANEVDYRAEFDKLVKELGMVKIQLDAKIKENESLKAEINNKEEEKSFMADRNTKLQEDMQKLKDKYKEDEILKNDIISANKEIVENVIVSYSKSMPQFKINIPRDLKIDRLLTISENIVAKLVKK